MSRVCASIGWNRTCRTHQRDLEGSSLSNAHTIRFGLGYDVHRFVPGRKLVLGGVEVPHQTGLEGHSDADVLLHAIIDALLGATAFGDIGRHFPNTDPRYKNISSIVLLKHVGELLARHRYIVNNIDATVVIEAPRLSPHIEEMRANIAVALGIDTTQVSIKATTGEGLGFIGAHEGAAAHAIASVIHQ